MYEPQCGAGKPPLHASLLRLVVIAKLFHFSRLACTTPPYFTIHAQSFQAVVLLRHLHAVAFSSGFIVSSRQRFLTVYATTQKKLPVSPDHSVTEMTPDDVAVCWAALAHPVRFSSRYL